MTLLALALQAALIQPGMQPAAQPAPVRVPIDIGDAGRPTAEQRRSVLADACGGTLAATGEDDVVVCGGQLSDPRLPDPDHRGPPTGPQPSNPYRTGAGALAAQATPCAATQHGCPGGLNLLAVGAALVKVIKGED